MGLRLPADLYSHPWDARPWGRTHVQTCLSSLPRAGPQGAGSRQGAAACLPPSPRAVALGRISAKTPLLLQCLPLPCLPLPPLGEMCTILDRTVSPTASSGGSSDPPPCDCVETGPPLPEPPSPALPAGCAHRVTSFQPFVLPRLCTPCARGHHPSGLREAHQGPGSGLKVSSLSLWPLSTALSHQGFGHICVCLTTVCIPRRT